MNIDSSSWKGVLYFRFTELLSPKQHFAKDATLDEAIRTSCGATLEAAARCELFARRAIPEGRLAAEFDTKRCMCLI